MPKDKNSKIYDLNEYGEISISSKKTERSKSASWQARFLKAMAVLLLITIFLIVLLNR